MHTPEENPCLCPESRRVPPQYIAALQDGFDGVARQAHRRDRRAGETGRPARQARRRDGRAVAGARPASSRIAGLAAQGACHGDLWRNSERGRRALGRRGLTIDTGAVSTLLCHRLLMSLALSPPHAEHRSPGDGAESKARKGGLRRRALPGQALDASCLRQACAPEDTQTASISIASRVPYLQHAACTP